MNRDAMPITILMADDDADDRRLTQEAFEEGRLINDVRFVEHGEELMDYLRRQGKYAAPVEAPRPGEPMLRWLSHARTIDDIEKDYEIISFY